MSAIKFKFRSSLKYDSVDIGDRASISVGELKLRIRRHMNLNVSSDSDLVLSDAVSGQEYKDENAQIPSNSSLIIKRVPAGSTPFTIKSTSAAQNDGAEDTGHTKDPLTVSKHNDLGKLCSAGKAEVIDFDDFGEDLCGFPKEIYSGSGFKTEKEVCSIHEKPDNEATRDVTGYNEDIIEEYQKLDQSDVSEDASRGNRKQAGGDLKVEDCLKLAKTVNVDPCAIQNDLPSELRCPLCDSVYKEAVMIPCCQHSFCDKCIRLALIEKGRCPKCTSAKYTADDLLPNLSLRQAIEHFLESENFKGGSENAYCQYAPDGESGIQVKDACGEVSVLRREEFVQSSTGTQRGSNHVVGDSARDSKLGEIVLANGNSHINLQNKGKQVLEGLGSSNRDAFKGEPASVVSDFQGESQPVMDQDSSAEKKKGLGINTSGGGINFMESGRFRRGDRACYMCGSLDHLMRDCPVAVSPDPMLRRGNPMLPGAMPGYGSPFWNGTSLPHARPFPGRYPYPAMMPFNAGSVPSPAFHVPMYMPSTYCGFHPHGGFMRFGGMESQFGISGHYPSHQDLENVENHDQNAKFRNQNRRDTSFIDREDDSFEKKYHSSELTGRAYGKRFHKEKETSPSCSDKSSNPRHLRKHRYLDHPDSKDDPDSDDHVFDERHAETHHRSTSKRHGGSHHHCWKSCSELDEDSPLPSSSNQQSEESHYHHYRGLKKDTEKERCDSDSSRTHKSGKKRREESNGYQKSAYYHHLKDDRDCIFHDDRERKKKIETPSHSSRHSRHSRETKGEEKSMNKELIHDRWDGSVKFTGGAHQQHCHKQNRVD